MKLEIKNVAVAVLALAVCSCAGPGPSRQAVPGTSPVGETARPETPSLLTYHRSAAAGDPEAQMVLGIVYEKGIGIPYKPFLSPNYQQAAVWYGKAADQGHAPAQTALGCLYLYGRGRPRDFLQARKWFRRAAEQGYGYARNNLGVLYATGHGVPFQDLEESVKWFELASKQGLEIAALNLARAESGKTAYVSGWYYPPFEMDGFLLVCDRYQVIRAESRNPEPEYPPALAVEYPAGE